MPGGPPDEKRRTGPSSGCLAKFLHTRYAASTIRSAASASSRATYPQMMSRSLRASGERMYLATSFALFDSFAQAAKGLFPVNSFAAIQAGNAFEELFFQFVRGRD